MAFVTNRFGFAPTPAIDTYASTRHRGAMTTARQAWLLPLIAVVVAACAAVVSWWLIGDVSAEGFARDELDYAFEPPSWSSGSVRVAGVVAFVVGATVLTWVLRAMSNGSIDRRWRRVVIVHVVDGVYLAYLGRVATAGVIGANIGLAGVLFFGLIVVGGLNAWGVVARTLAILSDRPDLSRRASTWRARIR